MAYVFEVASRISGPFTLTAFCVAAFLFILSKILARQAPIDKRSHEHIRRISYAIFLLVLACLLGGFWLKYEAARNMLYRLRVTTTDEQHTPFENVSVSTSIGGEPKRVSGGWEFDIPGEVKPDDGKITVYGKGVNSSLRGSVSLTLAADHNPSVELTLKSDESAVVRGSVEDEGGHALRGVDVSVTGYGDEHVITSTSGTFALHAHVAEGMTVRLHAEARHYEPLDQDQPAGASKALLVLHKKHEVR